MFEFIEKVVYINLEHRTDRKEQIETELQKVFPVDKIVRFNAIKHERGGIGCSMSHIGALELAIKNNWKNVLIVEDDMEWLDIPNRYSIVENLIKLPHDVVMLSGHEVNYHTRTYKLYNCCARTSYLVESHYYSTLLNNFKEGLELLQKEFKSPHRGDRYWNRLQQRDRWYIVMPQICKQRTSISDIEKQAVDYSSNLEYTNRKRNITQTLQLILRTKYSR